MRVKNTNHFLALLWKQFWPHKLPERSLILSFLFQMVDSYDRNFTKNIQVGEGPYFPCRGYWKWWWAFLEWRRERRPMGCPESSSLKLLWRKMTVFHLVVLMPSGGPLGVRCWEAKMLLLCRISPPPWAVLPVGWEPLQAAGWDWGSSLGMAYGDKVGTRIGE